MTLLGQYAAGDVRYSMRGAVEIGGDESRRMARRRMRRASGIQIKNRECIVCQGATAGARSKGAAVVEVRCKGNEKGS